MKYRRIPFSDWTPDQGEMEPSYIHVVSEGMPERLGYSPGMELGVNGEIDNSASSTACGGAIYFDQGGSSFLFAGDSTALWKRTGSTFTEVSGSAYAASTRWEFVRWKGKIIASNFSSPMQIMAPTASAFADIGGNPPRAATITASRNFLIAGYTFDATDNTSTARVRWSGLDDETSWTVSAVTQSDYQDLDFEGGDVLKVFGGEYGVVFQEQAITRMSYVGPPEVWQFDEIERGKGLLDARAAAQIGNKIFYLSNNGFEVVINGAESEAIGTNGVDDFFFSNYDSTKPVIACADPSRPRIYWNYMDVNSSGQNYKGLVYDYSLGKWGAFNLATNTSPTVTAISVGDMVPGSPDSGVNIAVLYSDNFLGGFDDFKYRDADTHKTIDITSGRLSLSEGREATVKNVELGWAEVDAADTASGTITVNGYRRAASFSGATTTAASGSIRVGSSMASVRKRGRYHDFRVLLTPDDVTDSTAVKERPILKWIGVEYSETGKR